MSTSSLTGRAVESLFPKTRRAILGLLYTRPDESFFLREVVDRTGLAVGQVQRELKVLSDAGVISREERGRHVYFRANKGCEIYSELHGIVAKTMGAATVIRAAFEHLTHRIRAAFIFGSMARGDERSESDVDLMVIGDATFSEAASAAREAERTLDRELNLTVYPPDEFSSKIKEGHHFLTQVLAGKKHFIIGDDRELGALHEQSMDS